MFFFFKQKTAYEMRISDWSSDVCSSDLGLDQAGLGEARHADEQAMAAGQQGDQGLIDHRLLAEDDTADRLALEAELVSQIVHLFIEPGVCGVISRYGVVDRKCTRLYSSHSFSSLMSSSSFYFIFFPLLLLF